MCVIRINHGDGMQHSSAVKNDHGETAAQFITEIGQLIERWANPDKTPTDHPTLPLEDVLALMAVSQGFAIGHVLCKGGNRENAMEAASMIVNIVSDHAIVSQQKTVAGDYGRYAVN